MRLSDFKDEKGVEVVAKLLVPIGKIASNKDNSAIKEVGRSTLERASIMLRNNPGEIKEMLAILADQDPAEYHCTAATVLMDTFKMISDPALLTLFGLQRQTPASSGSASETTEAPAQ